MIISFGYEYGEPPPDVDQVFDVRKLTHNLTSQEYHSKLTEVLEAVKAGKTVAIGCEYGSHRSPTLAEDAGRMTGTSVNHRDKRSSRKKAS